MNRVDAIEAGPITVRCLQNLQRTVPSSGRPGSDARSQIGDTIAHLDKLLHDDEIGPELDQCFDLAQQAGATFTALEQVRIAVLQETPNTLGGALIQNSLIQFCLATEAVVIGNMTFSSRQDVEKVLNDIQQPFLDAEEQAADEMDQMVFQALTFLHGATVTQLVVTERPLPSMLQYQFAGPSTTLVLAYRLYADASRADQVRDENKIVHPAFAPATGQALSA